MSKERLIKFPTYEASNGILSVYESIKKVPFDIKRVFVVSAKKGDVRGEHAHKKCSQILICISGKIRVLCNDGNVINYYTLDKISTGLLIPPRIWAKQEYEEENNILMVLCDRHYEQEDYIYGHDNLKDLI